MLLKLARNVVAVFGVVERRQAKVILDINLGAEINKHAHKLCVLVQHGLENAGPSVVQVHAANHDLATKLERDGIRELNLANALVNRLVHDGPPKHRVAVAANHRQVAARHFARLDISRVPARGNNAHDLDKLIVHDDYNNYNYNVYFCARVCNGKCDYTKQTSKLN